jgi:hypothetical protein
MTSNYLFHCHCGWTTSCIEGAIYADPPTCDICGCYMMFPSQNHNTGEYCIVERRKLYPYLQQVDNYMASLPYKMDFYIRDKVAKKFNVANSIVPQLLQKIEDMKKDKRQDEGTVGLIA